MQISRRTDVLDDHLIVALSGDFDLSAVARVRSTFHQIVRDGWTNVILDMSEVSFADSAALGILIGLQRRCNEVGGSCALVGVTADVSRLLQASQLESILRTADSVEHAAALFTSSPAANPVGNRP